VSLTYKYIIHYVGYNVKGYRAESPEYLNRQRRPASARHNTRPQERQNQASQYQRRQDFANANLLYSPSPLHITLTDRAMPGAYASNPSRANLRTQYVAFDELATPIPSAISR